MRPSLVIGSLVTTLVIAATASAGPIYNFASLSGGNKVTILGTGPSTIGPVSAQGFSFKGGTWLPDRLTARNEPDDRGLGVCSETDSQCRMGLTGGGDWNELSQLVNNEAILLSLAPGWRWTELWLSSFDSGGTGGSEEGKIYWGNSLAIATLLSTSGLTFDFGAFGSAVEGNILSLAGSSVVNRNARYILFVPDGPVGDNNDYLVYGASAVQVPEPATIGLLAVGLGAVLSRRRRKV
jgi:hypothetical protein